MQIYLFALKFRRKRNIYANFGHLDVLICIQTGYSQLSLPNSQSKQSNIVITKQNKQKLELVDDKDELDAMDGDGEQPVDPELAFQHIII